jgi:cell division protein FtsN
MNYELLAVALITFIMNMIFRIWDKKKEKSTIKNLDSETDKNVSEKRVNDIKSLSSLNEMVEQLTENYVEVNKKYVAVNEEFEKFKSEVRIELDLVKKENIELKRENSEFKEVIKKEQMTRKKWEIGIGKLIQQLKDIDTTPVWIPEKT